MPSGVYRRDIDHSLAIRIGMTQAWKKNPDKGKPRPDYVKQRISETMKATLARKRQERETDPDKREG